jgi:Subtilase family
MPEDETTLEASRRKRAMRPVQPFLQPDGTPRVRTKLAAGGLVEYRTDEAIVLVSRFAGGNGDLGSVIDQLRKLVGLGLSADDVDFAQAQRSGYLRVRFADTANIPEIVRQVNAELGAGSIAPNTVLKIGSFTADPMRFASGVEADPMRFASAFGADPMRFANSSSARPWTGALVANSFQRATGPGKATVAILDTGFPIDGLPTPSDVDFVGIGPGVRDSADRNGDQFLDIAAGHSTFIRGIIQRASPSAEILCEGVIHNDGDGTEADIANALFQVFDTVPDKKRLIVNLSFSGYYDGDVEPPMIAFWIRALVSEGAVVVAAAGNNGACRKKYPAAMPEVLSVGSIGPCGPSSFSNHGPWVNVSAPGEDLVSEFFPKFDGAYEAIVPGSVPDIDDFAGWAMWSGTSFSTPAVVGALAELIEIHGCTASEAVDVLVGTPGLFRLPDYGIIVNRIF